MYIFSVYYVPRTMTGTGDATVNKTNKFSPQNIIFLWKQMINKCTMRHCFWKKKVSQRCERVCVYTHNNT